jgi:23S rRNA (cytosine1962-C5)-methyltransferase
MYPRAPSSAPRSAIRGLAVSRATAGFIARGHPWVRPDRFTRGLERLRAGDAVDLVDERGVALASALADPAAEVCARVFHRLPGKKFAAAEAIQRAWERRAELHAAAAAGHTTCYRVVHGEADFLPGLRVERYADILVVVLLADCLTPHIDAICRALSACLATATIVVRDHRDDLRVRETASWQWLPEGTRGALDPTAMVVGHELGVPLAVRPFAGLATGIYVDQRPTRAWLRPQAAGKRVLNLFAYTGLFSTSLLQAGAATALDIDLSAPALAQAKENAELAGVASRHRTEHGECRKVLSALPENFDCIIVDPPTSAQGEGGWILRRDYPEVLRLAWAKVAPGGMLLACCNTLHGKTFAVAEALAAAAPGGRPLTTPQLGEDVPQLKGFPEGRPYQLAAVVRAA